MGMAGGQETAGAPQMRPRAFRVGILFRIVQRRVTGCIFSGCFCPHAEQELNIGSKSTLRGNHQRSLPPEVGLIQRKTVLSATHHLRTEQNKRHPNESRMPFVVSDKEELTAAAAQRPCELPFPRPWRLWRPSFPFPPGREYEGTPDWEPAQYGRASEYPRQASAG